MDILASGSELNALDALSFKIVDDAERHAFRRVLAQIIGLYTDLIVSIAHQHPDLDPDKPGGSADGGDR
jgi:hypothetical protein